jgi:DNA-binding NarL/FixJ family response regulator
VSRHEILVLEDHPGNAAALQDLLGAMDMDCRLVTTLDELRACLATGFKPCGALLDMQVPHTAGARPHEKAGESGIAMVQARWTGDERVPIVVVTAFRSDPEYVWAMAELDVDGFCAKSNIAALPDKLTHALKKAGRGAHAECVARDRGGRGGADAERAGTRKKVRAGGSSTAAERETEVTLAMLGEPVGRGRTTLRICGETRSLRDAQFAVLLRGVELHEREPGGWLDRFELGFGLDRAMTTRVRAPFKGLVPEGFVVFEGDQRKRFRLNPRIVVERVAWGEIAGHPDPAIRGIAEKALRRRGPSTTGPHRL